MFAGGVHRDDVEPQLSFADPIAYRKRFGSAANPHLLARIDTFFRGARVAAASRLDLDEHQGLAVDRNQIYFGSGSAKIPRDYPVAIALQILFSGALAAAAKPQLGSQPRD